MPKATAEQMWIVLQQLLPAIVIGAVITGVVFVAAAAFPPVHHWAGAFALAAGYVGGHAVAIGRWPAFPPTEATHWLPYFTMAALIASLLDRSPEARRRPRLWVWGIFHGIFLSVLLLGKWRYAWSPGEGLLWLAGLVMLAVVDTACFDALTRPGSTGPPPALILGIITLGTSPALTLSGSMLLGQLAMICGASVLVAGLAGHWVSALALRRNAVPIVVVLLAGLWLNGYFYAELPAASAILLALSPVVAVVPLKADSLSTKCSSWLQAGLVILAATSAVAIAFRESPPFDR